MALAAAVFIVLVAGVVWSALQRDVAETTGAEGRQEPSGHTEPTPDPSPQQSRTTPQAEANQPEARSYRVGVPQGWHRSRSGNGTEDGLILTKAKRDVLTAVVTIESGPLVGVPLERLPDVTLQQLVVRNENPVPVGKPKLMRVDGHRAISFTIRLQRRAEPLVERQVAVLRNNQLHLITFAATPHVYRAEADAFEEILRSWRWK